MRGLSQIKGLVNCVSVTCAKAGKKFTGYKHNYYNSRFLLQKDIPKNLILVNSFSLSANNNMGGKTALVVIATGSEELEAVATIDTLRRAGVTVTVAGLEGVQPVVCSRNVTLVPDTAFSGVKGNAFDAIILPGGLKGSEAFANSADIGQILKTQEAKGGLIAAICAAPTALKAHKIGLGKSLTSYPSTKDKMVEGNEYKYKEDRVVVDGTLITSRGPGTAIEFGLAIAEYLAGKEKSAEVAKGLLIK